MNKLFIVSTTAAILIGCGGGGGGGGDSSSGGSNPSPQNLELSLTDLSTQVSEMDSGSIRLSVNKSDVTYGLFVQNTEQQMVDIETVEPGLNWAVQDSKLTISGSSINKSSRTVIATLKASSGVDSVEANFELVFQNNSLDETMQKVNGYVNDPLNVMSLTELNAISDAYVKVLELLGQSAQKYTPTFDTVRFNQNLSEINTALVEVSNGADEDVLNEKVLILEVQINEFANDKLQSINSMAALNNSLSALPQVLVTFDNGNSSFFVGNLEYGNYGIDGAWYYSNEYQFIDGLIDSSLGNCSI
ncbi:hypothetical protein [Vibrio splendidus]|uniref:hypothetical protein n=1 Tax=Vibrio splendidus TaxID=29497 RepID=UPI003D099811